MHMGAEHAVNIPTSAQAAAPSKVDKRPRPEASQDMSEHEFRFFESEWNLYKRATGIKGQTLVDELWSCMSSDLKKLAFDQGDVEALNTEDLMMKRIKSLAVAVLHTAIHTVRLHEASQIPEESCKAFAARVRGIASNCSLDKKCECGKDVSFLEETVYHVVLAGLRDRELQEACTTQALLGNVKNISTLIEFCTAKESGQLSASGTVGAVKSSYKSGKFQQPAQPPTPTHPSGPCSHCGAARGHSDGGRATREKECKAYSATCSKCGKKGHFAAQCKSKARVAAAEKEDDKKDEKKDAVTGGVHYGFYGIHHGSWEYPPASSTQYLVKASPLNTSNRFTPMLQIPTNSEFSAAGSSMSSLTPYTRPTKSTSSRQSIMSTPTTIRYTRSGRRIKKTGPPAPPAIIAGQTNAALHQYDGGRTESNKIIPLCHMEHDPALGWREVPPMDSPTLAIRLQLHLATYTAMQLPIPCLHPTKSVVSSKGTGVADSGAQLDILPAHELVKLKVDRSSLLPLSTTVSGATQGSRLNIIGGIFLSVQGLSPNSMKCLRLFYVADNVNKIYLSLATLKGLGVLPPDFPKVATVPEVAAVGNTKCSNDGVATSGEAPCSCPVRTLPPTQPPVLPFPATKANIPNLKDWIFERYKSSAFNCCEKQKLPLMKGSPPLKLHLDPEAKPVAVHIPAQVPLHWQLGVKEGLDRDCRLGVLERVPVNTPARWQHRMMVVAKHDGTPRRTVDFRNLNKYTPRQTHHTPSPWSLASSIPEGTLKSTFDCWHGYHSLEIAEEDRELTSFITPWGRYRYLTLPQGVLSAGDAYTDRMDRLFEEFERMNRCIDDTAIWDMTIEEQFYRSCQFLDKCGANGIILNPSKFQFCQEEVNYLGFRVTMTGVKPPSDFMENILNFPTPRNITDVRSWYGAVAQISYSFATCPAMLPFRHLLSSKVPFSWSAELEMAFQASKQEIVRQCQEGVRTFNPSLPTCLCTDWSKFGMGFWLCQKRCQCSGAKPGCCTTGWQTVYVGSRFCHQAEQNYAPIEGEAKAAAWATDKCRFFLLGLTDFLLAVDHLPLIPIFSSKELGTIDNPRIRQQKVKLLPFRFTPIHIPGKLHVIPDTWSRRSDSPVPTLPYSSGQSLLDISNIEQQYSSTLGPPSWVSGPSTGYVSALRVSPSQADCTEVEEEEATIASIAGMAITDMSSSYIIAAQAPVRVITWGRLQEAAANSQLYQELISLIKHGLPEAISDWPGSLHPYYPYRHNLLVMEEVVLYGDRPLIPVSLRPEVMEHLHAAHSGSTTMMSRAAQSIFWPGMKQDITATRAHCISCTKSAPSNPSQPPHPPTQPDFPFSHCCMDFFSVEGRTYLALVDRYTGWLSILFLGKDDSAHVIAALREYFARWGISKELTSDGASVFTSAECKSFFYRWGVQHRVSSAYYPRANKRSEVAVKSAKRLVMENLGPKGQLDTDRFARALLLHRNTPDPLTGLSPAMILFGREVRDHLPAVLSRYQPRREWRLEADLREQAFAKRHCKMEERLTFGAKPLPPLALHDVVTVQDQSDPRKAGKWTKTGTVVEILPHDSYMVRIHGSRAPTQRNRKFLRKISPFHPMIPVQQEEFIPASMVLRGRADQVEQPALPAHLVVHPSTVQQEPGPAHPVQLVPEQPGPDQTVDQHTHVLPTAPAPQLEGTAPQQMLSIPGPARPAHLPIPGPARSAQVPPTAALHRQQPAAAPGQDVLAQLRLREAMGQVLAIIMGYATYPTNY